MPTGQARSMHEARYTGAAEARRTSGKGGGVHTYADSKTVVLLHSGDQDAGVAAANVDDRAVGPVLA